MENEEKEYSNKIVSLKFNLLITGIMYVILILILILLKNSIEYAYNWINDGTSPMETTQVSMFNNTFYRYAGYGEIIKGIRARELYNHAIEYNVEVIFHNESGDIIGNVSGDSIIENIKDKGLYKINYFNGYVDNSFSIELEY